MANGASGSSLVASIKAPRSRQIARVADARTSATSTPAPSWRSARHRADRTTARANPGPPARTKQQRPRGVHRRHGTAQEDAAGDQRHRDQHRQRPAQPIGVVPLRVVVVTGENRDQPARRAEQRQGTDPAGHRANRRERQRVHARAALVRRRPPARSHLTSRCAEFQLGGSLAASPIEYPATYELTPDHGRSEPKSDACPASILSLSIGAGAESISARLPAPPWR